MRLNTKLYFKQEQQMKHLVITALALAFPYTSYAQDGEKSEPTSHEARVAIASYERELRIAEEAYIRAVQRARVEMRRGLEVALRSAMKNGDLAEANAIQAKIDSLPTAASRGRTVSRPGLLMFEYARSDEQTGNRGGYVHPDKLGEPLHDEPKVVTNLSNWTHTGGRNAVADGFIEIAATGDYTFNSWSGWDLNALFIDGELVCGWQQKAPATVRLTRGRIPITSVGYLGAKPGVQVTWQPPGASEMGPIPPELLSHDAEPSVPDVPEVPAVAADGDDSSSRASDAGPE
jgi:hypothetical protein